VSELLSMGEEDPLGDFGGEDGTESLRIFSKPSAINGFGVPLPTIV